MVGSAPEVVRDLGEKQAFDAAFLCNDAIRLAPQVTARTKFGVFQDRRFLTGLDSSGRVSISNLDGIIVPGYMYWHALNFVQKNFLVHTIRLLGPEGFSYLPAAGLFHGFNVGYSALQIAVGVSRSSVTIAGVQLNYSKGVRNRFYPKNDSVDLHRLDDQRRIWKRGLKLAQEVVDIDYPFRPAWMRSDL